MTNITSISKDLANKKLHITREFNAPVEKVWKAWTDNSLLDKWWAPKPWKAETRSQSFKEGGTWLYCMVGPDGTKAWCRVDYKTIVPQQSFSGNDAFCDEQGHPDKSFPSMHWLVQFNPTATGTKVEVEVTFDNVADLEKIIEMGFEAGFTMAHGNLDELLEEA